MALKSVRDAVETRLELGFDGCAALGMNRDAKPPADNSPFYVVEYPVARAEQLTIGAPGSNVWREEGAFRVVLAIAAGIGTDQILAWADEIATLFRGRQFDGVQCWAPSSATLDDENDDGAWFKVGVAVPYQADVIG